MYIKNWNSYNKINESRKRKLTAPQSDLFEILKKHMSTDKAMHFDALKKLSDFKSFDTTFNALLDKGYVTRFKEGDGNNTYVLV